MGLALKCVNKSTVYLPKNKYSDFHVFGGSVSGRIKRRRAATWNFSQINIPKIHGGGSSWMRIKTPSTSSSCTNNTFVTYLVLELHKQEVWYSNKIVGFKPLPLIGVNAWNKYNCRSPSENRPEGHSWESNKKHINKSLTRIFRANNDDIGICKIWRNDGKSPVWIMAEWNQRWSSTIKEIEEMSLS